MDSAGCGFIAVASVLLRRSRLGYCICYRLGLLLVIPGIAFSYRAYLQLGKPIGPVPSVSFRARELIEAVL